MLEVCSNWMCAYVSVYVNSCLQVLYVYVYLYVSAACMCICECTSFVCYMYVLCKRLVVCGLMYLYKCTHICACKHVCLPVVHVHVYVSVANNACTHYTYNTDVLYLFVYMCVCAARALASVFAELLEWVYMALVDHIILQDCVRPNIPGSGHGYRVGIRRKVQQGFMGASPLLTLLLSWCDLVSPASKHLRYKLVGV